MIEYFKKIFNNSWAICKGLSVTLRTMFKPSITVQYPTEKLEAEQVLLPDGSVYVVHYLTLGEGKIQVWGLRFTIDLPDGSHAPPGREIGDG